VKARKSRPGTDEIALGYGRGAVHLHPAHDMDVSVLVPLILMR